jgi:hypothetical protein
MLILGFDSRLKIFPIEAIGKCFCSHRLAFQYADNRSHSPRLCYWQRLDRVSPACETRQNSS